MISTQETLTSIPTPTKKTKQELYEFTSVHILYVKEAILLFEVLPVPRLQTALCQARNYLFLLHLL